MNVACNRLRAQFIQMRYDKYLEYLVQPKNCAIINLYDMIHTFRQTICDRSMIK